MHTIEVLPRETYEHDKNYIDWENDVFLRFVKLFPTENICFVSDNAVMGVSTPSFVVEGSDYGKHSQTPPLYAPFQPLCGTAAECRL